jgi:hypothetical protein
MVWVNWSRVGLGHLGEEGSCSESATPSSACVGTCSHAGS